MPTTSQPRVEDIPRIAFVTRRFRELQGLNAALLGAGLIVFPLMAHALPPGYPSPAMQAWNFAILVFVLPGIYLQRVYRQTFGDAPGSTRKQFLGGISTLIVMFGGLADMFVQTGRPGPSFAAVALATCSIWIVARDWRWRLHHLIPAGAGIIAAVITATAPPLQDRWAAADPSRSAAYLLAFTIMGLGLVAAGLFDHWLLTSLLRPGSAQATGPRQALGRVDSGGIRAAIAAVFCLASGGALWLVSPTSINRLLPAALMLAMLATQMVFALFQISKAVHRRTIQAPPPAATLRLSADSLALMFVIALTAALESAVGSRGLTWLALAIGCASAWVAVRDWPYRGHYLIGAAASVAVVVISGRVDPAQSLAILIFGSSGALALEGLLDRFVAMRHRRHGDVTGRDWT